ncbi:MAG: preprotein translocase subunit SecA [Planctomycetota bacterium]
MASNNAGIPLIGPVLNKLIGSRNERFVKRYTSRVNQIGELEAEIRGLSDTQLRERMFTLRGRIDDGEKVESVLIDVFATAREAMDRAVGIRNIFNPEAGFDPEWLPEGPRKLYHDTKAVMDGLEPAAPEGEWLGFAEPQPGWRQADIPVELYEAVRELYPESRPPFRARPFDVQLIGAMVLSGGKIAEMKTGEGKTIVAPLACALAWVERLKVHVVTVNDYLVQRDRDWTAPFFHALGMTVGAIHPQHTQPEDVKRRMYECDVVYGTTSEFGFDYLRDNMKRSVDQQVQKKRELAIVDEVDSILIDEARTPLIISGPAHDNQPRYETADKLAKHLVDKQRPWQNAEAEVTRCKETIKGLEGDIRQTRDKGAVPEMESKLKAAKSELPRLEADRDQHVQYYELEMDRKQAHLTHEGITEAQRVAGIGSFYVDENMDLPHLLENALRAYAVYTKDKDYVIMNVPDRMTGRTEPTIVIVDTFTGRPMIGRQWSDGLHQAVECKEKVPIKQETQTVATVTIQNFFKMYKRLAGMTGTADTEAQEFHDIYSLDVVTIPTNKPIARGDHDDLMFLREGDKWDGICDEIKAFHDVGRPILVGTTSVEKSEKLSKMLKQKHGIAHNVLNAKQHEHEATIVQGAGTLGAVMIATNMAGRGTDIKLGALPREELLEHWLKRGICSRGLTAESSEEELRENVYRKVAPTELGTNKREVEQMDFVELELQLLRHWAEQFAFVTDGKLRSASAEDLREAIDASGRFLLHRMRWFENIEDLGGLHVIGTERHESRRIDNQLRGRSGRQGDNGSSRFYVSLDDDLMKMFAGETTMKLLSRMGMKEGDAIEHPWLSKSVERAQRKVEERNFQVRKNILEYDEVMEHQRQTFYGLRQRVLEGRDVKGLIFEYIDDAVVDAMDEYLDPDYRAQCAADFAKEKLDASILPDRLKGKDLEDMEETIRRLATQDTAAMIDVTLGEYMPLEGSEVSVDFDSAGLVNWAKSRFGVELDAAELREGGASERNHVRDMLEQAAAARIADADLGGLSEYADKDYGVHQLCKWASTKFGFEVKAEDIKAALGDEEADPAEVILKEARERYEKREIEYPVNFVMEMTMNLMRQNPPAALENLGRWAKLRFGEDSGDWSAEKLGKTPPQEVQKQLIEASGKFVEQDRIGTVLEGALATRTDEELDEYLNRECGAGVTDSMRHLSDDDRDLAIRSRVENLLRPELLYFERTILIDNFDSIWKDHLYEMDQLRDAIGFRAFSQQDPRIEYKREGSRLLKQMLRTTRDRVTDYIFKARISAAPPQQSIPVPRQNSSPGASQQRSGAGAQPAGAIISGPGGAAGGGLYEPPSAKPKPIEGSGGEADKAQDAASQMEAAKAARAKDRGEERSR